MKDYGGPGHRAEGRCIALVSSHGCRRLQTVLGKRITEDATPRKPCHAMGGCTSMGLRRARGSRSKQSDSDETGHALSRLSRVRQRGMRLPPVCAVDHLLLPGPTGPGINDANGSRCRDRSTPAHLKDWRLPRRTPSAAPHCLGNDYGRPDRNGRTS